MLGFGFVLLETVLGRLFGPSLEGLIVDFLPNRSYLLKSLVAHFSGFVHSSCGLTPLSLLQGLAHRQYPKGSGC